MGGDQYDGPGPEATKPDSAGTDEARIETTRPQADETVTEPGESTEPPDPSGEGVPPDPAAGMASGIEDWDR